MFAVPGWNLQASTLVQETVVSKTTSRKKQRETGIKNTKKRKRDVEALDTESKDNNTPPRPVTIGGQHTSKPVRPDSELPAKKREEKEERVQHDSVPQAILLSATHSESTNVKKKKEHANNVVNKKQQPDHHKDTAQTVEAGELNVLPLASNLTPLQAKMRNKLTSARFRHLNETLYTTSSIEALQLFMSSPELFADYHAGFAQQVKDSWPQNPVHEYVKAIKARGMVSEPKQMLLPLPRRKTGSCTIADLGCGDAPLARGCQSATKSLRLKFHNYDLHASNTLVTRADVSNLPLRDGEADIAIFCLSLMGTNWIQFVEEAWRILRGDGKGEVWVSEVKSRFGRVIKGRVVDNSVGKRRKKLSSKNTADEGDGPEQFVEDVMTEESAENETDVSAFVKVFTRRGFQLRDGSVDKRNKMFVSMIFTKTGIPTAGKHKGLKWTGKEYQKQEESKKRFGGGQKDEEELSLEKESKVLKPCVYKIR